MTQGNIEKVGFKAVLEDARQFERDAKAVNEASTKMAEGIAKSAARTTKSITAQLSPEDFAVVKAGAAAAQSAASIARANLQSAQSTISMAKAQGQAISSIDKAQLAAAQSAYNVARAQSQSAQSALSMAKAYNQATQATTDLSQSQSQVVSGMAGMRGAGAGMNGAMTHSVNSMNQLNMKMLGLSVILSQVSPELGSMIAMGAMFGPVVGGVSMLLMGLASTSKAAMDFESGFSNIKKTVNATDAEFKQLSDDLRHLGTVMPTTTTELLTIATIGGQMGIAANQIKGFTETVVKATVATDLSADSAATFLGTFANVMQEGPESYKGYISALAQLADEGIATETKITDMANRIVGAGKAVGMSSADILGLADALVELNIPAEMGGSAISRIVINIAKSVAEGGNELKLFAAIAGETTAAFKQQFQTDAVGALAAFISGLNRAKESGVDIFAVMDALGESDIRVTETLLKASAAFGIVEEKVNVSRDALEKATRADDEYNKKMEDTANKVKIAQGNINDLSIEIGNTFLPMIGEAAKGVTGFVQALRGLSSIDIAGLVGAVALPGGLGIPFAINKIQNLGKETKPATEVFGDLAKKLGFATKGIADTGAAAVKASPEIDGYKQQINDLLASLNKGTSGAGAGPDPWGAYATAARNAMADSQDAIDRMAEHVRGLEADLRSAQDAMRGFSDPRLTGMQAAEDEIFGLDMAIKQARLQELGLGRDATDTALKVGASFDLLGAQQREMWEGVPVGLQRLWWDAQQAEAAAARTTDKQGADTAESQSEALSRIREMKQLSMDLTFEPMQRNLKEVYQTLTGANKEVTFEQAMTGLLESNRQAESLTTEIASENVILDEAKRILDEQKAALRDEETAHANLKVAAQDVLDVEGLVTQEYQTQTAELATQEATLIRMSQIPPPQITPPAGEAPTPAGVSPTIPIIGHLLDNIFGAAEGGTVTSGGLVKVGERGQEIVNLPTGSSVIPGNRIGPATMTRSFSDTYNVYGVNQPIDVMDTIRRYQSFSRIFGGRN
jgi:TP901 family phage tail tape measure protein